METYDNGIVRVIPAPKPKPTRNGTRCLIEHSDIHVLTPQEYEKRLTAEGTSIGGVTSKRTPLRNKTAPVLKSGLDFKASLANCDTALKKMGYGSLLDGKAESDKPLFDISAPALT